MNHTTDFQTALADHRERIDAAERQRLAKALTRRRRTLRPPRLRRPLRRPTPAVLCPSTPVPVRG